jgi:hypothetical protein
MMDALLFSVRDAIRNAGFGYDYTACEIREDGKPPPRCGDWFVAVHPLGVKSEWMNSLNEYFDFAVTLTARCTNVPLDRIGDQLLARKLAEDKGFNWRANQISSFLHMDWGVLQDANNWLVRLLPQATTLYGFAEPAHFAGMEKPHLEGAQWLSGDMPDADGEDIAALVAQMDFAGARRLQAIAVFS